jgi:predicted ATPase
MITKWGVKNFKSILNVNLELAPLTIFCGVNSSGKSSFLQSIAMLVQNAREEEKYGIDLNGKLVDLGSFDKVYCNKAVKPDHDDNVLEINFTISDELKNQQAIVDVKFVKHPSRDNDLTLRSFRLDCKKEEDEKSTYIQFIPGQSEIRMDSASADSVEKETRSMYSNYLEDANIDFTKPILDSLFSLFRSYDKRVKFKLISDDNGYIGDIDHFIKLLIQIPDELSKDDKENYADKVKSEIADDYNIDVNALDDMFLEFIICTPDSYIKDFRKIFDAYKNIELSDWYYELSKLDNDKKEALKKVLSEDISFNQFLCNVLSGIEHTGAVELPIQIKDTLDYFQKYFSSNIKYLGPLREEPKFEYPIDISSTKDVDVKGKNTAAVMYYLNKKQFGVENYYSPEIFSSPDYQPREEPFLTALNDWTKYIEISQGFRVSDNEEDLRKEYKLQSEIIYKIIDKEGFAPPQVGTGVSQILPILVMCLAAPVDSTTIIITPEEQLHPKMQARLADFFIAMALSGRQCLIETHSEYIIEQLRYRTVMMSDHIPLHEKTKLYFVTKQDGISHFKNIETNEFGALSDFPEDFFDESHIIANQIMDKVIEKMESEKQNE